MRLYAGGGNGIRSLAEGNGVGNAGGGVVMQEDVISIARLLACKYMLFDSVVITRVFLVCHKTFWGEVFWFWFLVF